MEWSVNREIGQQQTRPGFTLPPTSPPEIRYKLQGWKMWDGKMRQKTFRVVGLLVRVTVEAVGDRIIGCRISIGGYGYGWRRGVVVSGVRRMNEVNARRARLQLGWVTVFGRVYHLGL